MFIWNIKRVGKFWVSKEIYFVVLSFYLSNGRNYFNVKIML